MSAQAIFSVLVAPAAVLGTATTPSGSATEAEFSALLAAVSAASRATEAVSGTETPSSKIVSTSEDETPDSGRADPAPIVQTPGAPLIPTATFLSPGPARPPQPDGIETSVANPLGPPNRPALDVAPTLETPEAPAPGVAPALDAAAVPVSDAAPAPDLAAPPGPHSLPIKPTEAAPAAAVPIEPRPRTAPALFEAAAVVTAVVKPEVASEPVLADMVAAQVRPVVTPKAAPPAARNPERPAAAAAALSSRPIPAAGPRVEVIETDEAVEAAVAPAADVVSGDAPVSRPSLPPLPRASVHDPAVPPPSQPVPKAGPEAAVKPSPVQVRATEPHMEPGAASTPMADGKAVAGAVPAISLALTSQPAAAMAIAVPVAPPDGPATSAPASPASPGAPAETSATRPEILLSTLSQATIETTAQIVAQISRRLEGRSTRFEMALTPEGLGRVDVSLDIDSDGQLAARLAFDNLAAATDLRGRADELRRQLEEAGFTLARDALDFAERDASSSGGAFDRRQSRAFAKASRMAADADLAAATPTAAWVSLSLTPRGVDMKV